MTKRLLGIIVVLLFLYSDSLFAARRIVAANLPVTCTATGRVYVITDAANATDCTTGGGGSSEATCECRDDGTYTATETPYTQDDLSDDLPTALSNVTTINNNDFCQGNAGGGFDCDVTQNAGTSIASDLEEEAHVTEHEENGADELLGEAMGTACTTGQVLKANASGGLDCGADNDSGGATALDAIGDATATGAVEAAEYDQTWNWTFGSATAAALEPFKLTFTYPATVTTDGGTQTGFTVEFLDNAGDATGQMENLVLIDNNDANDAPSYGLRIDATQAWGTGSLYVSSTADKAMRFGDATNPYLASYISGTEGGIQYGRNAVASGAKLYATNTNSYLTFSGGPIIIQSTHVTGGAVLGNASQTGTKSLIYGSTEVSSKPTTELIADKNTTRDRNGADLALIGGAAGATNRSGGTVFLRGSAATGSGTDGTVTIQDTDSNEVAVFDAGAASAVNHWKLTNAPTGSGPTLAPEGDDATAPANFDAKGAAGMNYGSADVTAHTFNTDSTGTAEVVMPAGSVDSTEILDGTIDALDLNTDARSDTCFQTLIPSIAITDEWEIELPDWPGTMTEFRCEAQGGTSFTLDICDGEDLGDDTCTTSVLGGTLVCDTTGANDNTLSAADFVANDSVSIVVTAVSGSVTWARIKMNCQRD